MTAWGTGLTNNLEERGNYQLPRVGHTIHPEWRMISDLLTFSLSACQALFLSCSSISLYITWPHDRTGSPTQAGRRSTVGSSGRPGICVSFQKHQKTHFCA